MAIIEWSTLYPVQVDTNTQQGTLTNNVDKTRVSQIHALRDAGQELQTQVGTGSVSPKGNVKVRLDTIEYFSSSINFLSLNDTPTSYSGVDGYFLKVTGSQIIFTSSSLGVFLFTDLSDTPSSFVGQAGKILRVNGGETALELVESSSGGSGGSGSTVADQHFLATASFTTIGLTKGTPRTMSLRESGYDIDIWREGRHMFYTASSPTEVDNWTYTAVGNKIIISESLGNEDYLVRYTIQ